MPPASEFPAPNATFLAYVLTGAVTQILATALMLSAMRERAFSVVTAYTKTEPVQVALFGLLLLGDHADAGHGAGDRRSRPRACWSCP